MLEIILIEEKLEQKLRLIVTSVSVILIKKFVEQCNHVIKYIHHKIISS